MVVVALLLLVAVLMLVLLLLLLVVVVVVVGVVTVVAVEMDPTKIVSDSDQTLTVGNIRKIPFYLASTKKKCRLLELHK